MKKNTAAAAVTTAGSAGLASLLVTVIMVGLGERIGERFLPVYLVAAGATLFAPSILNALDNFLSAIYSIPGGWFSTKFGYKKALFYFNAFAILGYLIVIIFPGWLSVIIGSVFFLSWSSLSMPACMDLIQQELPKNRQVMGVSVHSLIKRVPMALGPVLGGLLIDRFGITQGIRLAFIIAVVLGLLAILIQQLALKNTVSPEVKKQGLPKILPWHFPRDMQIILAADILAKISSQIPYAYVAIWAMEYAQGARISATQFGLLTGIEMAFAILVYIPIAFLGDKFKRKGFIQTTFVLYTIFPVLLFFGRGFGILLLAFIVRGLKEIGEPTRKIQIMSLAPENQKALYFGAFYFFRDVVVTGGVFLGGWLWVIRPELNLLVSMLFGLSAVLLYGFAGKSE
jgi:MFS family permease